MQSGQGYARIINGNDCCADASRHEIHPQGSLLGPHVINATLHGHENELAEFAILTRRITGVIYERHAETRHTL